MYTHLEVEPNTSCPMSANMVFKNLDEPRPVLMVRIFEGEPEGKLFRVTGWSSQDDGSSCQAFAVQVEDSSQGNAYLVYGGDWGVRLAPVDAKGWSLDEPDQWGETHLVLADLEDLILAESN